MKIDLMPMSINDAFRKNMNRTVFIVIALTLAWYMGGCGGNNDVGNPASENTVVFENERLFFQRNYTYRDYASSCRPENIYQNVLSAYINESQTKFQLKAANDTVYLQGELDETLIHSFTDTILGNYILDSLFHRFSFFSIFLFRRFPDFDLGFG